MKTGRRGFFSSLAGGGAAAAIAALPEPAKAERLEAKPDSIVVLTLPRNCAKFWASKQRLCGVHSCELPYGHDGPHFESAASAVWRDFNAKHGVKV
jgi:hypothetical protein